MVRQVGESFSMSASYRDDDGDDGDGDGGGGGGVIGRPAVNTALLSSREAGRVRPPCVQSPPPPPERKENRRETRRKGGRGGDLFGAGSDEKNLCREGDQSITSERVIEVSQRDDSAGMGPAGDLRCSPAALIVDRRRRW